MKLSLSGIPAQLALAATLTLGSQAQVVDAQTQKIQHQTNGIVGLPQIPGMPYVPGPPPIPGMSPRQQQLFFWQQQTIRRQHEELQRQQQEQFNKQLEEQRRRSQQPFGWQPYGYNNPYSPSPNSYGIPYSNVTPKTPQLPAWKPIGLSKADAISKEDGSPQGAYIQGLTAELAATNAFQIGEVITAINDIRVWNAEQVMKILRNVPRTGTTDIHIANPSTRTKHTITIYNSFFYRN